MEEEKYYNTVEILKFLGIEREFKYEKQTKYPFCDKPSQVKFSYGYITIPRKGIEKVIQNKISDKEYRDILDEIKMLVHINFYNERTKGIGSIVVNLSLTFRYDKEYKYGDIKKSLPEVCYAIERMGTKTNDFYIIGTDTVHEFMSYFVINNQWGIGATEVISSPEVKVTDEFKEIIEWY
jgi:hypothetical protein